MATMQPSKGPESLDLGRTVSRSRSTSMSSDSQLPRLHLLVPPSVNPAPCFIASSAAAQIVTADQEFNAADFVADEGDDGSRASALVTPEALSALNGFLDHLLFNILAASKSTQLDCIRPAVAEVLKPRLAKEVVSAADEELSEYMGGPEDEQFGGQTPSSEFDLIRSWKLTRLRCMVYTRLGDMEEDDEEEYIEQDGLGEEEDGPRRFSSHIGYITPAAAIFLAHIIEYLGEKALVIAGETARSRLTSKINNEETDAERSTMDRLVVEDLDMEKLALNPTLGRLWRTWRKRTRSPNLSRATSRESIRRRGTVGHLPVRGRRGSLAVDEFLPPRSQSKRPESPAEVDPASIALPVGEHDVQEIEVPGFVPDSDGGEVIQTMEAVVAHKVRPRSLMVLTLPSPRSPTSNRCSPISPRPQSAKTHRHARSRSLPSAPVPQEAAPEAEQPDEPPSHPSPTSSEERRQLETMYEHDEVDEPTAEKKAVAVESSEQVISPSVESPTKKSETDSFPEESTGQDTAATSSISGASVEVVTSQANSTRASSLSDRNQPDSEAEIIEGQGMAEKPRLASMQRPRRKSSREPSRKSDRSTTPAAVSSEQMVQPVAEDPSPTQGGLSTPAQPAVSTDASSNSDTDLTSPDPVTPQPRFSTDTASEEKSPRPPSSAESAYSEHSRVRQRPSPLPLRNGSNHQQSHYGRSSPAVSTTSSGTERAAVQRLSRPTTSAASSNYYNSKPRRSESFSSSNRDKRPVTAGSTTSQVSTKIKGLIVRQGESNSLRVRSSSETSRGTGDSSPDEKTGLDDLIRSEETIHYTLTPRSMREIEEPDSPRWRNQRSSTADLADFLKNTAPPGSPRPGTSSTAKGQADLPSISKTKSSDQPKHKPIQASNMSLPPSRPSAGQSRDTKASIGSTRDFANSIKSNGPPSPSTMKSRIRRFSDAADFSKKFSRPPSSLSNTARSAHGPSTAPRLQARPAIAPKGDQSSDLIDFIREGPPTAGARRIPRTVAPFRDTMDEDELQSLEPSYSENQAPSIISTQDESFATKSVTSVGSRTGLLDSSTSHRTPAPASAPRPAPIVAPEPVGVSDDPRPARKQRRVPDPYAIDSDDDEDLEELLEGPKPPKREEESLMDFLMNAPPPPDTTGPPQPFSMNAAPVKAPSSGTSSMKSRLLRNGPFDKGLSAKSSKTSLRQPPAPINPPPVSANYTTKVGMERNAGARSNSYNLPSVSERQTETSALADFLRSTGPPEPPVSRTPPPGAGSKAKESSSGFSRLFVRRKKVEA